MRKIFNKYLPVFLIFAVIIMAGFFWLNVKKAEAAYSFSRTLTLNHLKVPSTQSNFTVLICANGTTPCNTSITGLNQTGGGAHVQNSNGFDIIFSSTFDCATLMKWETEKYVASTGEIEARVLITSLSSSADIVIYMCYGNAAISSFQGGSVGTAWNANYLGVWHFSEGSGSTVADSTSNGNTGTVSGTTWSSTAPYSVKSLSFAGAGQVDMSSSTVLSNIPSYTYEAWVQITSNTASNMFLSKSTNKHIEQGSPGANGQEISENANWSGADAIAKSAGTIFSASTWYLVDATFDNAAKLLTVYANGVATASSTATGSNATNDAASHFLMGVAIAPYASLTGLGTEVRFLNTALSANWITTEYNNESSPSTFETFGTEQSAGGGTPVPKANLTISTQGAVDIAPGGSLFINNNN